MRSIIAFAACAVTLFAAACGDRSSAQDLGPPKRVPDGLVPASLASGTLEVREYDGKEANKAFARAGEQSLVSDGKLWEVRRGTTLVGVLQMTTVKPKVDLADAGQRDSILGNVLAGGTKRISISDVDVSFAQTEDQVKYVWFGDDLFEVLTVKASKVEPEAILREIIEFQTSKGAWRPLPTPRDEDG